MEFSSLGHQCQWLTPLPLAWPPLGAGVCSYMKGFPASFPSLVPIQACPIFSHGSSKTVPGITFSLIFPMIEFYAPQRPHGSAQSSYLLGPAQPLSRAPSPSGAGCFQLLSLLNIQAAQERIPEGVILHLSVNESLSPSLGKWNFQSPLQLWNNSL